MYNSCLENPVTNPNSNYTDRYGYFPSPVGIKKDEIKRSFPKLSFVNKGHDAINLDNILHHKSVKS